MNLLLFIFMIVISYIAIHIGAVAFHLTGLEWSLAKFQSLSCFTSTGFTTKEAELITTNPQRRRIAAVLMVLGNAGFVALIATSANTLRSSGIIPDFKIPFLPVTFPARFLPAIRLLIILTTLYVTYKLFTHSRFSHGLTKFIRKHLIKKEIVKQVSFEEVTVATSGYGIIGIDITEGNPLANKTIMESKAREHDINILVLERGTDTTPNPRANTKILIGDRIICFGKLLEIKKKMIKKDERSDFAQDTEEK